MPYVQRSDSGAIVGMFANIQQGVAEEFLQDTDSAVVAFQQAAKPVPAITDRQFFQQLAVAGIITQDEALAANAAVIPSELLKLIEAMPADQQFGAKMIVSGATTFERDNPLTIAIGTAYGMTPAQIDAFFTAAAQL